MLFKKVSGNYYQAVDSKGNARRISKSRYLKETASKKVSRKNKKTYSRAIIQQLGGAGNINFKKVRSLVFVATPVDLKESASRFGGWTLADKYTRQALDSVLANYNFGSLNAGREVGFCFADCDGRSHTKILNAKDGDKQYTFNFTHNVGAAVADTIDITAATRNFSQFLNPFATAAAGTVSNPYMVGEFIGVRDLAPEHLPSVGHKRIWIMIVKVTEPNNCSIGAYGSGTDNNYSGRTMYRYYRCMPIYQNADISIGGDLVVSQGHPGGTHTIGGAAGAPNIHTKTGSIIGFASFQELTILELASHQGNVLGYRNNEPLGTNENNDWVGGTSHSMQQSMATNAGTPGDKGIYNFSTFYNWEKYLRTERTPTSSVVTMGILADIAGGTIGPSANDCINYDAGSYVYAVNTTDTLDIVGAGSATTNVDGTSRTILNGARSHRDPTNSVLNRTTWIGCHPSIHWGGTSGGNALTVGSADCKHSNFAILARLLRKYNTISLASGADRTPIDYTPGWGGGTDGKPATGTNWDGSTPNGPVWLPSILNKQGGPVNVPDGVDNINISTHRNIMTNPAAQSLVGYSLASQSTTACKFGRCSGYSKNNGTNLYIHTVGTNAPTFDHLQLPIAGALPLGPKRTLLFL